MLGDPITITQSSVDIDYLLTGISANGARYRTEDGEGLTITHQQSGRGQSARDRHEMRINFFEVGADPFVGDLNRRYEGSLYLVVNLPSPLEATSFTTTDVHNAFDRLVKITNVGTNYAALDRVIRGES